MSRILATAAAIALALAIGLFSTPGSARVGQKCGGFVGNPHQCGGHEFCQQPAGRCVIIDFPGTCVTRPDVCILRRGVFYIPECGCNHVTYRNDCERRRAGVSLLHRGAC
jgi:hypothetical protein